MFRHDAFHATFLLPVNMRNGNEYGKMFYSAEFAKRMVIILLIPEIKFTRDEVTQNSIKKLLLSI